MRKNYINTLVSRVFKILCWWEEGKNWIRLYDELLIDLSMNNGLLDDELCGAIVLKIAPLKYLEGDYFKKRIFEVMNYLNGIDNISE